MTDLHTANATEAMTLDRIATGEQVRVVSVGGQDAITRRLGELGVRRGIVIEVMQRAPLGDPTVFELCGYQLCLRATESARVAVAPLASGAIAITKPTDSEANAAKASDIGGRS